MTYAELQVLIGSLTSDPNHDRYSLTDIGTELDNSQNKWNLEAKIVRTDTLVALIAGSYLYELSTQLSSIPIIDFTRVTHRGLDLKKRSKTYFDLYYGGDWTLVQGTPDAYYVDLRSSDHQYLGVYPTPTANDVDVYLVVEYFIQHTPMSASSDYPFTHAGYSNYILRPYDYGLAYDASARLLARDPNEANAKKSADYLAIANGVLAEVVQVFKSLNEEEPKRLRGGRQWVF